MSTLLDLIGGHVQISDPAVVTAAIIAGVAGVLIITGAAARVVTFVQQLIN